MNYIKILFILFSFQLQSQNLVQNPSFENTKRCSEIIGAFGHNVESWTSPTFGTTDLFNTCAKGQVGIPNNYNGFQQSKDGNNFAGFYLHSDDNYREYVQVELSKKLVGGKKYKISFFVSLAENSDFAIKNIDFLLSENELNTSIFRELSDRQLKKNNIEKFKIYVIENDRHYDNKNTWTLISTEFTANGNEKYLTIGNFLKNSKTEKLLVSNKNRNNMSYYYIDLVNLHDADWTETKPIKPVVVSKNDDKKIAINKDYTFQNVVFDFNSSELSKGAKSEIKSVYNLLTQNQGTKIIISGHTDNVGGSKFNQALSEKRAKSVTDYFISLGLEEGSISYFGYGNEKPIATNDTEDGRNKNRRVEFKIVENN
ncbi:OmpA family protein [Lacinutrix sp. C3R15]|uniref:OmpA family protein n=1 Tax=Flavobacteriaceae TaxID=49546 RepID=UPI001C0A1D6E|nr:OmpA family protein [Oceanihabitans sp. 1_MG-2023]MBU2938476.1 OmpA family protein [Lacinutrix sp. C3R15]MDO6621790.1 OmpA family protein [Oceanihabitans sp. 1_MG-2023]